MHEHVFTLQFKGGVADSGHMPVQYLPHYVSGTRRLLAYHASFYLTGKVPAQAKSESNLYTISVRSTRSGSYVVDFTLAIAVSIAGASIYDIAKYSFTEFFADSIRSIVKRKPFEDPIWLRREPYFEAQPPKNHPIKPSLDSRHEREKLDEKSREAIRQIAYPVGRCAGELLMYMNGHCVAQVDRWVELEITEAIIAMRERLGLADTQVRT